MKLGQCSPKPRVVTKTLKLCEMFNEEWASCAVDCTTRYCPLRICLLGQLIRLSLRTLGLPLLALALRRHRDQDHSCTHLAQGADGQGPLIRGAGVALRRRTLGGQPGACCLLPPGHAKEAAEVRQTKSPSRTEHFTCEADPFATAGRDTAPLVAHHGRWHNRKLLSSSGKVQLRGGLLAVAAEAAEWAGGAQAEVRRAELDALPGPAAADEGP